MQMKLLSAGVFIVFGIMPRVASPSYIANCSFTIHDISGQDHSVAQQVSGSPDFQSVPCASLSVPSTGSASAQVTFGPSAAAPPTFGPLLSWLQLTARSYPSPPVQDQQQYLSTWNASGAYILASLSASIGNGSPMQVVTGGSGMGTIDYYFQVGTEQILPFTATTWSAGPLEFTHNGASVPIEHIARYSVLSGDEAWVDIYHVQVPFQYQVPFTNSWEYTSSESVRITNGYVDRSVRLNSYVSLGEYGQSGNGYPVGIFLHDSSGSGIPLDHLTTIPEPTTAWAIISGMTVLMIFVRRSSGRSVAHSRWLRRR